jgi:hypothetical protein
MTFRMTNKPGDPAFRMRFCRSDDRWKAFLEIEHRWFGRSYWHIWFFPFF